MTKGNTNRIGKELQTILLLLVILGGAIAVSFAKIGLITPLFEGKSYQPEYFQQGRFYLPQNNYSHTRWNAGSPFYPDAELIFNITLDANTTTGVQISLDSTGWNNSFNLFLSPGESYQGAFQTTFTTQLTGTNFLVLIQMEQPEQEASGTCWVQALDLGTIRTPTEGWPWFFYLATVAGAVLVVGGITMAVILLRRRKHKAK